MLYLCEGRRWVKIEGGGARTQGGGPGRGCACVCARLEVGERERGEAERREAGEGVRLTAELLGALSEWEAGREVEMRGAM